MYSMNQAKTLAGVVTSQTNNGASFSKEVENNVSNSTPSVIELFEKGTKQEPDLNTECKLASLNVISNGSDSSIIPKIGKAGDDFPVSSLMLDDSEGIKDEFNAVCEANGIGCNGGYSPDQFNVGFSTSSNYQTYNIIEVHEEDRKSVDKPKSLPKIVCKDNSRIVAPPSPRTSESRSLNIAPPKPPRLFYSEPNGREVDNQGVAVEPIYVTIDRSKKSSNRSLDSGIGSRSVDVTRSNSQVTEMSESCGGQEQEDISLNHDSRVTLSTSSSEKSDNEETPLIKKEKKTNRILPRVKYAVQQKEFIIFGIAAVALSVSAALVYLQDKAQFFANSPLYITIPMIAIATLLVISPVFCGTKQFKDTEECKIQKKNANEALNEVLEYQPKDKVIRSVRLEYSNGTHSKFTLNAWKGKNKFINIDEKVISRSNKVESVIKDRPLFTTLLTGVIATHIALSLGLLAKGNVGTFYQNILSNNIGISLLMGSSVAALLIVCLGVHYYRKTNCTNLIYSEERIDPKTVNEKFIEEIKEERTKVLEENHSKDAKRSSLTLEQVVIESHNYKDAIYSVG